MMEFVKKPKEIEDKSMSIIAPYLESLHLSSLEKAVYSRMIHASGDVEYAHCIRTQHEYLQAGVEALRKGAHIYCDVEMVRTGINRKALSALGSAAHCLIRDEKVAEYARRDGITRSMAAMRFFGKALDGQIIAIGNAPTALFEVMRLMQEEAIRPALIVGIPVGFVGAAESKAYLDAESPVPYVTVSGTKGGSSIAAAVINALLYASVHRDDMLDVIHEGDKERNKESAQ